MHRVRSFFCVVVIALLLVVGDVGAITHTGKTFLLPQAMRFPFQHTFYNYSRNLAVKKKDKKAIFDDRHLMVSAFCRRDRNRKEIGEYFGRAGSNVISIGLEQKDFQATNLIFTDDRNSLKLKGKLELAP